MTTFLISWYQRSFIPNEPNESSLGTELFLTKIPSACISSTSQVGEALANSRLSILYIINFIINFLGQLGGLSPNAVATPF